MLEITTSTEIDPSIYGTAASELGIPLDLVRAEELDPTEPIRYMSVRLCGGIDFFHKPNLGIEELQQAVNRTVTLCKSGLDMLLIPEDIKPGQYQKLSLQS